MKLTQLATTAIATTAFLFPVFSADVAKAQNCIGSGQFSVCLGDDGNNNRRLGDRSDSYNEINDIYREVLGRNPNSENLDYWSNQLNRGTTVREIRRDIAQSREAEQRINQIYRQEVGRNIDRNSLETYTNQLANGWSLSEVRRDIQSNGEGRRSNYPDYRYRR